MLQPPGLWDLLLWQLGQLCVWCSWFLCCGKGRCQQHVESIDCNKVTVKPIWLVVPLPLETLAVRLICKAKIIPVDVKAVQIHPLWNSSVFGAVCLGQTGDLAKAWAAD